MAISIKYIQDMVKFVIDKTHHSIQREGDVDLAAYESSLVVFGKGKEEYEMTSTITEHMSVFEKIDTYNEITSPTGFFDKPTDYNRYIKITTEAGRSIDVVTNSQWDIRRNHPTKVPTSIYPIARIAASKIEVLPSDVKIHLYYFKNPQEPKYVENGAGDYDPVNSVGLEWSMDMWPEIGNLILGKLGINLGEQQIIEYSERQKK